MPYLIIHDCISYRVIGAGGRWLEDQAEALRFDTSQDAEEYCRENKIDTYTLRVKFNDADDNARSKPTIFALMTFWASDSACALNALCCAA